MLPLFWIIVAIRNIRWAIKKKPTNLSHTHLIEKRMGLGPSSSEGTLRLLMEKLFP